MEAKVIYMDGTIECTSLPEFEPATVSKYDAGMKQEVSAPDDKNVEYIKELFGKDSQGNYILERIVVCNKDDRPIPDSLTSYPIKSCVIAYREELPSIKSIAVDGDVVYGASDEESNLWSRLAAVS